MRTILECLEDLKELAPAIESEYSPDDGHAYQDNQQNIKKLDQLTRDLINLQRKVELQNEALSKFKEVTRIDGDPEAQFKKFVENAKKKHGPYKTDKDFQKDTVYQEFYSNVRRVHHPNERMPWQEDDDIIVETAGSAPRSFMCVITQEDFVEPMKAPCGHTFSKEGILGLLQTMHGSMRCPVAGCNRVITKEVLQPDVQTQMLMERSQRRTQLTQPSINATALDDSDSDDGFGVM